MHAQHIVCMKQLQPAAAHRECLRRVSWLQNRRPWEGCVAGAHGLRGPRGHPDSSSTNRRVTEHAEPNPAAECARAAGIEVAAGSEECGERKEAGQGGALSGGARRDGGGTDEAKEGGIWGGLGGSRSIGFPFPSGDLVRITSAHPVPTWKESTVSYD